jgi:hypothetical protein
MFRSNRVVIRRNNSKSESYMQKLVGEGMWEGQDQDGWMKLTHARRMGIRM